MEEASSDLRKVLPRLFCCFLCLSCFQVLGYGEARLAREEVSALKSIAKQLGKRDWDFRVDPCSGEGNWTRHVADKGFESYVTCECPDSQEPCHVINLVLKAENLSGSLPPQVAQLKHLQQLDLSRNLLTGTIPPQWATLRLQGMALMANRLSGPFPQVVTKITSLQNLSLEANFFVGPLPPELGKLIKLEKLVLTANEFSGTLPASMANLTALTDLRINSNNFFGKIPEFIGRWTELEKLHMQGCSFEGPIPSSISGLAKLADLRISDIYGTVEFPRLERMESLKILILRNCSIKGNIPEYVGELRKLKNMDLSFNNLVGELPRSFTELSKIDFMYLTGNMLSGAIPGWIFRSNKNVDLSYNNFTWENSNPTECLQGSVNLVESYSPSKMEKINYIQTCLERTFPCPDSQKASHYALHINCGGKEVIINGTKYESDEEARGASMFHSSKNWAFSSTGNFMDNDMDADYYIAANTSKLSMPNSELYARARLSPLSLTYYGLCMVNGNYTVKLHFAEIVFSGGNAFTTLGRRIFNVFIQGKLVLKDFNIEKEAGGTGKAVIEAFTTLVTNHTLEIQFYWAGKGTSSIPSRGVYGPLISAISVDPNFEPPSFNDKKRYAKILSGIIAATTVLILLVMLCSWKRWMRRKSLDKDLKGLDLQTGSFTLRQIRVATKNFDPSNKIGEGGFGSVYKGSLSDGTVIAVKQLSSKSKQGNREFVTEIGMISALQHPNLVKLYGCCMEGHQLLLVYEFLENNCLARALFGKDVDSRLKLDWPTRKKICLGIARGLAYMHEESRLKIIHRDIKASNVLLDKDLNAKISDFGLAKLADEGHTHISTRVAGTIGYMAPEYAMRGYLTAKADIYSFGVVALEVVSGKSNTSYRPKEEFVYLLDWAYVLQERGDLLELVDPNLGSDYSTKEALAMLNVALLCTNASPTLRPTMSTVVSMLEGRVAVQPPLSDSGTSSSHSRFRSGRNNFWQSPSAISTDVHSNDSFASASDKEESEKLLRLESFLDSVHLCASEK